MMRDLLSRTRGQIGQDVLLNRRLFMSSSSQNRQPRAEDEVRKSVSLVTALSEGSKENIHALSRLPHTNFPFISLQPHFTLLLPVFIFTTVFVFPFHFSYIILPKSPFRHGKILSSAYRQCSVAWIKILKTLFNGQTTFLRNPRLWVFLLLWALVAASPSLSVQSYFSHDRRETLNSTMHAITHVFSCMIKKEGRE